MCKAAGQRFLTSEFLGLYRSTTLYFTWRGVDTIGAGRILGNRFRSGFGSLFRSVSDGAEQCRCASRLVVRCARNGGTWRCVPPR